MELLEVNNLSFKYVLNSEETLHDISFSLSEGDFLVVSGPTGCGKSTLLRMLKRELTPAGEQSGSIKFGGVDLSDLDDRMAASAIGFVLQLPEQQIVTDKVWHELAFGLENMNVPRDSIRRRVAEMAGYFGIEDWYEKSTDELSGGQKQLLNLAAIMVMQPLLLILDEPTSQLDPIAASDFLATVQKLNREMGLTVILVEHRLDEAVPMSNKLMIMEDGCIVMLDSPSTVCSSIKDRLNLYEAMPVPVKLFNRFETDGECPLTVQQGRNWIDVNFGNRIQEEPLPAPALSNNTVMELKDIRFRYSRNSDDVLRDTNLTIREGELLCILGGNGSGKSTVMSAMAGINRPYSGSITVFKKDIKEYRGNSLYNGCIAMLPQDVQTVFLKNTVREELADAMTSAADLPYDLEPLMDKHPYDLSGGEQQLVALAKVLAAGPKILLLDEPTKGLDASASAGISLILKDLKARGTTIIVVTHDLEFAAITADRCALFFRGEITSVEEPRVFFSENNFYTTAVSRMTRGYFNRCVTLDDAERMCRLQTDAFNR